MRSLNSDEPTSRGSHFAAGRQAIGLEQRQNESSPTERTTGTYELTESGAIPDVLRTLRRSRTAATVRSHDGRDHAAKVTGLTEGDSGLRLSADVPIPLGPCLVRLTLHEVVFVLRGRLTRAATYELCGPLRLFSVDRRAIRRQPIPEGEGELSWCSPDSASPTRGHGLVRDLTPDGVGMVLDPGSSRPPPGIFPALLRVRRCSIPCLAETRREPSEPRGVFGLRLRTAGVSHALVETYLRERLPRLAQRDEVDPEKLYGLMRDSGYLALRAGAAGFNAWQAFQPEDGTVSFDRVYRATDNALLGHTSCTRLYNQTWLLHQLACLSGHAESGEARIALYMMMASVPRMLDGDAANILAYFDQENRWHQLFFRQFVRWVADGDLATICAFDRFERADSQLPPTRDRMDASPAYHIRPLRYEELLEATALVRSHLPPVTAEALDIYPTELHRPSPSASARGRTALALHERGEITGLALCETGDPNLSLFNIVNMAQIYARIGPAAPAKEAQRALIQAVRLFYAERGTSNPMLVAPQDTFNGELEPGTHKAESMGCVAFTGRALRQWESFCLFHLGRRWRRHRQNENGLGSCS